MARQKRNGKKRLVYCPKKRAGEDLLQKSQSPELLRPSPALQRPPRSRSPQDAAARPGAGAEVLDGSWEQAEPAATSSSHRRDAAWWLPRPSCIAQPFHFIIGERFLKISMLTSKPGSLGNKGGRDGSHSSVPILRISNVVLNKQICLHFLHRGHTMRQSRTGIFTAHLLWYQLSHAAYTAPVNATRMKNGSSISAVQGIVYSAPEGK